MWYFNMLRSHRKIDIMKELPPGLTFMRECIPSVNRVDVHDERIPKRLNNDEKIQVYPQVYFTT